MTARSHCETVDLGLNVNHGFSISFQPCHINFNIKMSDTDEPLDKKMEADRKQLNVLAHDGVFWHDLEMLCGDNISVTGGSDKDVGLNSCLFHGGHFITSHSSLESIDGINFSNDNTSTIRSERLGTLQHD